MLADQGQYPRTGSSISISRRYQDHRPLAEHGPGFLSSAPHLRRHTTLRTRRDLMSEELIGLCKALLPKKAWLDSARVNIPDSGGDILEYLLIISSDLTFDLFSKGHESHKLPGICDHTKWPQSSVEWTPTLYVKTSSAWSVW